MSVYEQTLPAVERRDDAGEAESAPGIRLRESMRMALTTLMTNKMRSILTALGVIIGVAAVVALLALGRGAQAQIAESITANGANLLTLRPGSLESGGFSQGNDSATLTLEDAAAIASSGKVPDVTLVSPEPRGFGTIMAGSRSTSALITGVTPTYLTIHNDSIASGQFITDGNNNGAVNVAVLGSRIANTLFPGQSPVGQSIRISGQRFRVVGVLAPKGGNTFGSADDGVLAPLNTLVRKLFVERNPVSGKTTVSAIVVQVRDDQHIDSATSQLKTLLRERHRLPAQGGADDFSIDNQQDIIDTLTQSQRTLTLYLGAIAAISLVVGGIGIMNIMLVSVHERTREIGLRKAIGARERDILTQFMIEALLLSVGGGLIGLLSGVAVALVANQTGQARAEVSPSSMVLAVGVAVAIGLFFGIEPARRAARLDPIDALRSD